VFLGTACSEAVAILHFWKTGPKQVLFKASISPTGYSMVHTRKQFIM